MNTYLKQAAMLVCALVLSASAAGADPVTTVTLRAPAGHPIKDAPVTFGQVFRKGDIKQGVLANALQTPVQTDVKRTYDDGSVRFAVVSLVVPELDCLEEAYFWGNYSLLAQWPVPRQDGRGIMADQIRGNAWGLRNIADAGFIAPDGEPEAEYFAERIHNNLAELTAKMLGPPESNRLGFWGLRTVDDARIQNAANPRWMITAPWEHDFLIWSLHHLTELGYSDAAGPRDFELRWRVGVFTHPGEYNPLLGAPYRMAVGETGPDKQLIFYEDWKKLGEENAKLTKIPEAQQPRLAYDYSAYVALTCGVDAGAPQAAEAVRTLLEITGGFHEMLADPAWRIVPRNALTEVRR